MSRPLGATNCSCQQLEVQSFFHYIEGSTAQLVKHKALNLMDVGSSPMLGVTSYDVIFIKEYIKSQLNIILLSRPLGATYCCSSLHDHIYTVPAHYCIITRPLEVSNFKSQVAASMTTRHLGATYVEYSVLTGD